jgi:hypothetical protein
MYSFIELYLVHFHTLMLLFHVKIWLMHNFVINTPLLALCYSDIFWPSKGHLQRVQLILFHSQIDKICTRCKIQFIERCVLCYAAAWAACVMLHSVIHAVLNKLNFTSGAHFVDLAMKMYQSYFLKMARWGPKHVGVTVLISGMLIT